MRVLLLQRDGRCTWLERKVIHELLPLAIKTAANPFAKRLYVIVDWISNDEGRVGVDLKWFRSLGVPAVKHYSDLPTDQDFKVVNTGYDSIVEQELALRDTGVEIVDRPCPFVRKLRGQFEGHDPGRQYVFLCESNHLMVKNFAAIFPDDMLLVQMDNYQEVITSGQAGKPLRIVPYVTFLPRHSEQILDFVNRKFPERNNDRVKLECMWVNSHLSPIVEIEELRPDDLAGISEALLITTAGSTNKSLVSLEETLRDKGLAVRRIGSFTEYLRYQRAHRRDRVLVVRSPIPNRAEAPIMGYLNRGLPGALVAMIRQNPLVKRLVIRAVTGGLYLRHRVLRERARREAAELGMLKDSVLTAGRVTVSPVVSSRSHRRAVGTTREVPREICRTSGRGPDRA